MPKFDSDTLGGNRDRVHLLLDGVEVVLDESYEIRTSLLQQPASFNIRVGHEKSMRDLLKLSTPNTFFELYIAGVLQHSGTVDGPEVHGEDGGSVDIEGRDDLRYLNDDFILSDYFYNNYTYKEIVEDQLTVSYPIVPTIDVKVIDSNQKNRFSRSDVNIDNLAEPVISDSAASEHGAKGAQRGITSPVGENRLDFIRRIIDRAGLFLWAGAVRGEFILGKPNINQPAIYQVVRTDTGVGTNARLLFYKNRAQPPRYAKCVVYGRAGGKKEGRSRIVGSAIDPEMLAWGFSNTITLRDVNVPDVAAAGRHAARKLAEGRRAQWQLVYEVEGHITTSTVGTVAIWCPDTIVRVKDDFLGIDEDMWLDDVIFQRSSEQGTTTTLGLMRKSDLLFGNEETEDS